MTTRTVAFFDAVELAAGATHLWDVPLSHIAKVHTLHVVNEGDDAATFSLWVVREGRRVPLWAGRALDGHQSARLSGTEEWPAEDQVWFSCTVADVFAVHAGGSLLVVNL